MAFWFIQLCKHFKHQKFKLAVMEIAKKILFTGTNFLTYNFLKIRVFSAKKVRGQNIHKKLLNARQNKVHVHYKTGTVMEFILFRYWFTGHGH